MTTKLNLTIEEGLAKKIKLYARRQKTSVSKITEEYFSRLLNSKQQGENSFVERHEDTIKKYSGKALSDDELDQIREEYLRKKHGL